MLQVLHNGSYAPGGGPQPARTGTGYGVPPRARPRAARVEPNAPEASAFARKSGVVPNAPVASAFASKMPYLWLY